jgi:hypothetical protein
VRVIKRLTHKGDSGLSFIRIKLGHVEIIHEVDELTLGRSNTGSSLLLELRLKHLLEEGGISEEIEVDDLLRVSISLLSQLVKETLDNLGLTTSSSSYKHRRDVDLKEFLHEVLTSNGISSRHGVVGDRLGGINRSFDGVVSEFVPVFHLGFFNVYEVIENCSLGGEFDDLPGLSPELIESDSGLVSFLDLKTSSHAPNHGENEDVLESLDFLLGEHDLKEFADSIDLRDNDIGDNVLEEFTHLLVSLIKVLIE